MPFLFYVDESGSPQLQDRALREQPFLVMAAVGIRMADWWDFEKAFLAFAESIVPRDRWDPLTDPPSPPEIKGASVYKDAAFPEALRNRLRSTRPTIIAVAIDKAAFSLQSAFGDPYTKAYEMLLERVDNWAKERQEHSILVLDSRGRAQDARLRNLHVAFQRRRTSQQPIRWCIEQPFMVTSALTAGVQMADVAAHVIYRAFRDAKRHAERGDDPLKAFQDERFLMVSACLRRSMSGRVWGYGLKLWPEDFLKERWGAIERLCGEYAGRFWASAGEEEEELPF
jgi:hypothetical protein